MEKQISLSISALIILSVFIYFFIYLFSKRRYENLEYKIKQYVPSGGGVLSRFYEKVYRFFGGYIEWLTLPFEKIENPTLLTFLGLFFGVISGVFFGLSLTSVATFFIILCGVLDLADGKIARKIGKVSKSGAFLDSVSDRITEISMFIGLSVGLLKEFFLVPIIAMSLSFLVSYVRARGEGLGLCVKGGIMRRQERLVILGIFSLIDGVFALEGKLVFAGVCVIAFGSLVTALMRIIEVVQAVNK